MSPKPRIWRRCVASCRLVHPPQPLSLQHKKSVVRPYPESPTIILVDASHESFGKAIVGGIDPQPVATQTQKASSLSPRPETAVFAQRNATQKILLTDKGCAIPWP
jgi:hypothetical protein